MKTANILTGLFLAAFAVIVAAPPAQAFPPTGAPTTTDPGLLEPKSAATSTAIFLFADSAHTDELTLNGSKDPIFNTKPMLAVTPSISVSFLVCKDSVWMT